MRNAQSETTIETENWQSLSEIEQIRLSAAIASQIFCDLFPLNSHLIISAVRSLGVLVQFPTSGCGLIFPDRKVSTHYLIFGFLFLPVTKILGSSLLGMVR
ncbi:MAG UNVERIFIED_CONTAM: hypothetical protein LVR29_08115 [Microcystis novacekii LVE1205-3]|jgi:hypothetical protein